MLKCKKCNCKKFNVLAIFRGVNVNEKEKPTVEDFADAQMKMVKIACEKCKTEYSKEEIENLYKCECEICGAEADDLDTDGVCSECIEIYKKINSIYEKNNSTKKTKNSRNKAATKKKEEVDEDLYEDEDEDVVENSKPKKKIAKKTTSQIEDSYSDDMDDDYIED